MYYLNQSCCIEVWPLSLVLVMITICEWSVSKDVVWAYQAYHPLSYKMVGFINRTLGC